MDVMKLSQVDAKLFCTLSSQGCSSQTCKLFSLSQHMSAGNIYRNRKAVATEWLWMSMDKVSSESRHAVSPGLLVEKNFEVQGEPPKNCSHSFYLSHYEFDEFRENSCSTSQRFKWLWSSCVVSLICFLQLDSEFWLVDCFWTCNLRQTPFIRCHRLLSHVDTFVTFCHMLLLVSYFESAESSFGFGWGLRTARRPPKNVRNAQGKEAFTAQAVEHMLPSPRSVVAA